MRTGLLLGVAVAAATIGFIAKPQFDAPPASASPPQRTGAMGLDQDDSDEPQPAAADGLAGRVEEVIDVAQYSYLRLSRAEGEVWAAVNKAPVSVGSQVAIENATRMDHFESKTLKRTFDVIYFGSLSSGVSGESGVDETAELPPGHPSLDAAPSNPHAGGLPKATDSATVPEVKVTRAAGANAHDVAELFAGGEKLAGKLVRVRGQVVKVTNVLEKNFVRIRDDSSAGPKRVELTLTSQADAVVGSVATFEGTLRTQVDVGIGFTYPVLLENARIIPDPSANL